jgi:hypothetical protein
MNLTVQANSKLVRDPCAGSTIMIPPPIGDKDYWLFRVNLFEDQSVIAFPKFGTIGIGFAIEDDWNTNLPYKGSAESICNHIWHNRRYVAIKKKRTIKAIEMLQEAIKLYMEKA